MIPPRLALAGCGTLALTIYCWTAGVIDGVAQPLGIILHTAFLGGAVALLLLSALARGLQVPVDRAATALYRVMSVALVALLAVAAGGSIALSILTASGITGAHPDYTSDAAAFNHFNAQLVLQGINPYSADGRFWHAIAEFPDVGATPLERGRYAGPAYDPYGPGLDQIVSDVKQELAHPGERGPEYDPATLHSYPALAFLLYVPNIWAGWPSTAPTGLVFLLLFSVAAVWGAPRALWPYLLVILLANQFLILGALRGEFEPIAYLLAILAWRLEGLEQHRWLSPVLLGLSAAVKQIIWPLIPLYFILSWRRHGMRTALVRLIITVAAFLAPNLPFLLTSPGGWVSGLLLPVTLPLFPSGVGLIELTHTGLIPVWPSAVYGLLEIAALVALYLWCARSRAPLRPELYPLLALLPFFLAWRSLLAYFLVLPVLAIYASLPLLGGGPEDSSSPPALAGAEEVPSLVGVRTGTSASLAVPDVKDSEESSSAGGSTST
jgi:hypothetical protein